MALEPVTVNPSTGVSAAVDIAFDEVVGVGKFQMIKQDIGGDGASVPFTDPSTGARQDTGNAALANILTGVDGLEALITTLNGAVATQATLAAVLAKIIAAPATEAKQDAAITELGNIETAVDGLEATLSSIDTKVTDSATQTTLAAVLAKIIAAPATEALQTALNALHPALVSTIPLDSSSAPPVRVVPADLWRTSFADVGAGLLASEMTLLQTGAGQAVSQAAGSLLVTTGTTINSETLMRSVRTFRGAHIMRYRLTLSQRIVNQTFQVAMADLVGAGLAFTINSATSVTVTFPTVNPFATGVGQFANLSQIAGAAGIPGRFAVASVAGLTATFTVAGWPASGSGTLTMWGYNFHRILYDAAVATTAQYDAQRRGWASGNTAVTTNTTAAPGHLGHLQSVGQIAGYADALVASNAAYQFTSRGSRLENIPDDSVDLYLFVQVLNGTVAPASTTTLTLGMLSVEMTGRQKVYLSGGDQMGGPMAPAVQVVNLLATQPVSGTVTATVTAGTVNPVVPATPFILNSLATTNIALIITGTSGLQAFYATNTGATAAFVKLYNKATAPVLATDVPAMIIPIPAAVSGVPGVAQMPIGFSGHRFALGLGIAITGAVADTDATAVAAGQVKVMLSRTI